MVARVGLELKAEAPAVGRTEPEAAAAAGKSEAIARAIVWLSSPGKVRSGEKSDEERVCVSLGAWNRQQEAALSDGPVSGVGVGPLTPQLGSGAVAGRSILQTIPLAAGGGVTPISSAATRRPARAR